MTKSERKPICLLMNLGGFETRMNELLLKAYCLGDSIYSLTGDGIMPLAEGNTPVPVNVMSLSRGELHVWSSLINEQLREQGMNVANVVILAAGRKYCGVLPLGTAITQGFRIGA
ncbi:hypothetical protein [Paenibacillus rubinfantis]|uniref:hypothetical protein n=1 Tax=Paenibacillus rubinfantis TaxID=1720296 RepID=UPI00073F52A5|nr:hypothetical protein [Paenibacillus rubinfantis]